MEPISLGIALVLAGVVLLLDRELRGRRRRKARIARRLAALREPPTMNTRGRAP